jgi:hypothetical protein
LAVKDPITHKDHPVVGLRIPYVTAFATGKMFRILSLQFKDLPRMREIPDSVDEFTGFLIEWDPIAGTPPGAEQYRPLKSATGKPAVVRNVTLPQTTSHLDAFRTLRLATNESTRRWINA